jgi:hypothetical protein
MSKVKFNKNDPKQVGSLGLHIMGINDMPADKWLSYFTSEEIKSYAISDEQGFIGRLPPLSQERVMDLLTVGYDESFHRMVDRTDALLSGSTKAPVSSVVKETVTTDKGIYVSVEVLREKLTLVYKMDSFNGAFIKALDLTGLSVDIEYISEPAKKKLLSNLKVAMVSEIESIVDNV